MRGIVKTPRGDGTRAFIDAKSTIYAVNNRVALNRALHGDVVSIADISEEHIRGI